MNFDVTIATKWFLDPAAILEMRIVFRMTVPYCEHPPKPLVSHIVDVIAERPVTVLHVLGVAPLSSV